MNALADKAVAAGHARGTPSAAARRGRELARRFPRQGQSCARASDRAGLALSIGPRLQAFPDDWDRTRDGACAWSSSMTVSPCWPSGPSGTGSVLLLGTGVHVDWTNLPLKPIFLPLLARLTFHLAGTEAERTMALAGVTGRDPAWTGPAGRAKQASRDRDGPPLRRESCGSRKPDQAYRHLPLRRYARGRSLPGPAGQPATRPSRWRSPSTSTRPRPTRPRPLARSCRPASASGRCSTARARRSGRDHPTAPRGNQPVGVVPGGRLGRPGPGGLPRQSRRPGGLASRRRCGLPASSGAQA